MHVIKMITMKSRCTCQQPYTLHACVSFSLSACVVHAPYLSLPFPHLCVCAARPLLGLSSSMRKVHGNVINADVMLYFTSFVLVLCTKLNYMRFDLLFVLFADVGCIRWLSFMPWSRNNFNQI